MQFLKSIKLAVVAFALCTPAAGAWAQWQLDNEHSSINFISIKNDAVAETHSFTALAGTIDQGGVVQVGIDLNSVETLIDIRNERMREMLFETGKYPAGTITAQLDAAHLAAARSGGSVSAEVPVKVSLHGQEKVLSAAIIAIADDSGQLRVFSARPIVVNAADFGLQEGVAALQKIAGLDAISSAVPVTLHLLFKPVAP